jgi:hypothetical protein
MTWVLAVLLLQPPVSQADQIRAAMAASIEKQRASVQLQVQATGPASTTSVAPAVPLAPNADTAEARKYIVAMVGYLADRMMQ